MSDWNKVNSVDLSVLATTRKSLHQAVQIVGAVPRNVLPHDPTDTSASLAWNDAAKGLQSIAIPSDNGDLHAGLSFIDFSLYLWKNGNNMASFELVGNSTNEGLNWMKSALKDEGVDSSKINLKLPYEIENYDYSQPLHVDREASAEFAKLYENTFQLLSTVTQKWEKAFDIRCWPHHFDLATLIPVAFDEKGELSKSIGVGLSPGDEAIAEPYVYVNVWPNVSGLEKHPLAAGHWNKEGWSGAVLTYSQLLAQTKQEESFHEFAREAMKCILGELK